MGWALGGLMSLNVALLVGVFRFGVDLLDGLFE